MLSCCLFPCFLFLVYVGATWITTHILVAHIQTFFVFLKALFLLQILRLYLLNDAFIVTSFLFCHTISFLVRLWYLRLENFRRLVFNSGRSLFGEALSLFLIWRPRLLLVYVLLNLLLLILLRGLLGLLLSKNNTFL